MATRLNDRWTYWRFEPSRSQKGEWKPEKMFTFDTVEDFLILSNNFFDESKLTNGMTYLMRGDIPPVWEDPVNINGAAWTFKVDTLNRCLVRFWQTVVFRCLGETICANSERVVGISISPKRRFATVRLWLKDCDDDIEQFSNVKNEIDFFNAQFKKNSDIEVI